MSERDCLASVPAVDSGPGRGGGVGWGWQVGG